MTSVAALIPARAGSKGLPGKNLRLLAGVPLLVHSIAAGRDARRVDHVYVSTEDAEIADIARTHGAEIVERPAALATDTAQNDAVAIHALAAMRARGQPPEILVLLQPTSPLRTAQHVDECLDVFLNSGARSAMSICAATHHPSKCITLAGGLVSPLMGDRNMEARRQGLPEIFRQNGAIYAIRATDLEAQSRFYVPPCAGYVMPRHLSIDIDDELDLQMAAFVMAKSGARAT